MTEIKLWLLGIDSEDDIYFMYISVKYLREMGAFSCEERKNNKSITYFLKCSYLSETLILTEKSREYFLNHLDSKYSPDVESWYDFKESLKKE